MEEPYRVEVDAGAVVVRADRPLTPREAQDLAQALLAATDEALGEDGQYRFVPPA